MSNTIDVEATSTPAEPPPAQGMALERRPEVGADSSRVEIVKILGETPIEREQTA